MSPGAPPTCAGCGTPLPWDVVDRGAGTCAHCGAPFAFTAHLSERLVGALTAAGEVPSVVRDAEPMFRPNWVVRKPAFVTVTSGPAASTDGAGGYRGSPARRFGTLDLSARFVAGAGPLLFFAIAWNTLLALVLVVRGNVSGLVSVHVAVGVGLAIGAWRELRPSFRLVLDGTGIVVDQRTRTTHRLERIAADTIRHLECEVTYETRPASPGRRATTAPRRNHAVVASLADGRRVRLLAEIHRVELAWFVMQELDRRLGTPPT